MIGRLLDWWGRELGSVLRTVGDVGATRSSNFLELVVGANRVEITHQRRNRRVPVGERTRVTHVDHAPLSAADLKSLEPTSTTIRVRLEGTSLLESVVELPLAAEENLRTVVGYEMGRLTPFRAESVYFDAQVVARRITEGKIDVRLTIVPRKDVEEAIALLGAWDDTFALRRVSLSTVGRDATVELAPAAISGASIRRVNLTLLCVNLVLASVLLAVPVLRQGDRLDELRAAVAEARSAAVEVEQVRDDIELLREKIGAAAAAKHTNPSMVELIEELSTALPDGTWLIGLRFDQDRIELTGASDEATALIALLEQSTLLYEVSFLSSVIRDRRANVDRFVITAMLADRREVP